MVLADTGEDAVVRCAACGYGANLEKAETGPRPAPWKDETETPLVEVETPGKGGIDDVVEFLGITASRMIKCLVYETEKGFVVALLRGDLDVNEVALKNALGVDHLALALGGEGREGDGRARSATSVRTSCRPRPSGSSATSRSATPSTPSPGRAAATGTSRASSSGATRRSTEWGSLRAGARRRPLPALRQAPRHRARHRGRPHLQARHEVLDRAEVRVHRREGGDPARRHGHVRHRRRPDHGGGGRAAPRRRRDRVAAGARALRDRARLAEPLRRGDAPGGRRALRGAGRRRASTSSTTTATSGPASSSRTRTSSASRSASTSADGR